MGDFITDYIKSIENPDRIGWNGKVWGAPTLKGYDTNQRGYGIDIRYNNAAKNLVKNRKGLWLTDKEATDLMNLHLLYITGVAKRKIKGFNTFSPKKQAAILGMLYRGDSVQSNVNVNEPNDTKFLNAVHTYYKNKGLNQRMLNSINFFSKYLKGGLIQKMLTAAESPIRLSPEQIASFEYMPGMNNSGMLKFRKEGVLALQYLEQEAKRKEEEIKSRMERRPVLKRKATFAEKLQGKKDEYEQVPLVIGMSGADPVGEFILTGIGLNEIGALAKTGLWNNGIKTLWNNGKLILKDIPRKAENFYRAVNKDAINDAKKYGIIRGRKSRKDNYPFFGRSSEPYHDTKYIIEGTPESADWISTYKYVYNKNPEIVRLPKIPDRDYSKAYNTIIGYPESNGFLRIGAYDNEFLEGYEALPMTNGQLNISPSSNFVYWKKHPIIGWRKYNFKQGGKMNVIEQFKKGYKIKIKESLKGSFTKYCNGKVTNECIQRGKNSPDPKIRKKATFAANSRKWKHLFGGQISKAQEGEKLNFWLKAGNALNSDWGKFAINAGQLIYSSINNGIQQTKLNDRLQKWKQAYINSIEPKDFSLQVAEEERLIKLANPDYNISPIVSAYKENILATQAANKAKQKASQEADLIIMLLLLNLNESSNSGGGFGSLLTEGLGLAGQFLSSKKSNNTGTTNLSTSLNGSPNTYNVFLNKTYTLPAPTIPIKYNNFTS